MGGRPSPPSISYIPAPPPPVTQQVTSQSLQSQIELAKVGGAQQRLNLETGAKLDRTNEEFFATQDIRRLGEQGVQQRLNIKSTGAENRQTTAAEGTQRRLTVGAMGEQERKTEAAKGAEQRLTIGTKGTETRKTAEQQELVRRYKEQRDDDQSQTAYKA